MSNMRERTMKCPCGNKLFTDQTGGNGRCTKCNINVNIIAPYSKKPGVFVDTERLEQTQVDKQELIDAQGYDQGGHYNIQTVTERNFI